MYKYNINSTNVWTGQAVDKQVNHGAKEIAAYWINNFLMSDFQSTPRQGTMRLAIALKNAIANSDDSSIKHEIASSAKLANNMPSKAMSISEFCDNFHLTSSAKEAVCSEVNPSRLLDDKFVFDQVEFEKHLSYKMVELDNGAILTAPSSKFDKCFESQTLDEGRKTRFTTVGKVVDEKLKRTR